MWVGIGVLIGILVFFNNSCQTASTPEPVPATPAPVTPTAPVTPVTPSSPVPAWTADTLITDGEYQGGAGTEGYEIFWNSDDQYIYIGIRAETSGWVAVGFEPSPLHRETDTIIGFASEAESGVHDMFSTGDLGPCQMDTDLGGTDDILEAATAEADGYTTIEFKRALDTGDAYDGRLVNGTNEIIWAYSNHDDPRQKHTHRGRLEISLP